jgi:TRAP-type C4-dicarboxylate transport system substrate-binding protein
MTCDVRHSMSLPSRVRRLAVLALVAAALALALPPVARAQGAAAKPREWKLSTAVGPAFALGRAGERWAKLVAERSGGRLPVKHFPGATLAQRDPAREFLALAEGTADLAVGSTLFWAVQVKALGVVGLPWLAPEPAQVARLPAGATKDRLDAAIAAAGAVPLAYAPLAHRALALRDRSVRGPADLAGLRVRIPSTPYLLDFWTGQGAQPEAMGFAEAQAAFRSGALEAQDGDPAAFAAARLDAVGMKHVVVWGAVAEVAVFAVNRAAWNALAEGDRALVAAAAQDAARELATGAPQESDAALAELRRRGFTVTRITEAGIAPFAAAARPVYARWAAVAGEDLVRDAEAAVKAPPP